MSYKYFFTGNFVRVKVDGKVSFAGFTKEKNLRTSFTFTYGVKRVALVAGKGFS